MENSVKMIGEYLIADGRIMPAQVQKALEIQADSIQGGHIPLLGTILVQMGAINEQDLAFALEHQERERMRIGT
jgi:hypothetical protein